VSRDAAMFVLSPRRVVEALIHAMELPDAAFGVVRAVQLPGITAGIGELVDALERIAGRDVAARIRWEPDPLIQRIVAGWPARVSGSRALGMGFKADASVDEIIRAYIEDELGGSFIG
jgi:nucleoside-diphosphate-sugar epimerase